ncbi:MAG: rRNA pseudouridine synthase [Crocinitomicaceae bacterium]|nr:rRNA pseudouridine synthase [Crocinitomicaceae bacterium]
MNTRKKKSTGNDSKKGALKGRTRTNKGAKAASRTTIKAANKAGGKGADTPKDKKGKGRFADFKDRVKKGDPLPTFSEDVRLNKYLSNAGICSRRDADILIKTGVVTVNGKSITEMGFKVKPTDVVKYDGGSIKAQNKRYVLLNKPKGFITTMDDPQGRKTVMTLVHKACKERIYPVGRLDKDTTGLMLFTNDGDMAKKLTHPLHKASKIYQVELNKKVTSIDLKKLVEGIKLEDGTSKFDEAKFINDDDARLIGVELHSGKNQIVRRTFEALGYKIMKLDRVTFSGLTKKDLPRGMYRHLTEKEVSFLKMVKAVDKK